MKKNIFSQLIHKNPSKKGHISTYKKNEAVSKKLLHFFLILSKKSKTNDQKIT